MISKKSSATATLRYSTTWLRVADCPILSSYGYNISTLWSAQDIPQNSVRDKSKQNRTKSNILSTKPLCDYGTYPCVRNFHWNVQNAIVLAIFGMSDSKSFRLDPEAKFCVSFDLGLSQQISADFVKLFSRDCLRPTVFPVV